MPHFIQGGDTSELVLAAKNNLVPHPPGYPLWQNIAHLWLKSLSLTKFNNYFWQSSLLCAFFALGVLLLIIKLAKNNLLLMSIGLLSLGLSSAFLEAALLPDVFSLHALFCGMILYFFINDQARHRDFTIAFIFALALSHHHTIIFISPLIIYQMYQCKLNRTLKIFFKGLFAGLFITTLLYISLIFKNTGDYFSWGDINSLSSLWDHFLRNDYGVLKFAPQESAHSPSLFSALFYYIKFEAWEFSLIIITSLIAFYQSYKKKLNIEKSLVLIVTYFFSLSFFLMTNFKMEAMGLEIIKRFFVMPNVILIFLFINLLSMTQKNNYFIRVSLWASLIFSLYLGGKNLYLNHKLSFDSTFRDYAEDMLLIGKLNHAQIIEARNDNSYFAMRYLAALDNEFFSDIAIVSPSLLVHPWYLKKLKARLPKLRIFNEKRILDDLHVNIEEDIIRPNIHEFNYMYATKDRYQSPDYQTVLLPVGKIVTLKNSVNTIYKPNLYIKNKSIILFNLKSAQGFSKRFINSQYAHYYLEKAMKSFNEKDTFMAINWWKKAIMVDPYCLPAYKNICQVDPEVSFCSKENLANLSKEAEFIY